MGNLRRSEKETVISFNEGKDMALVFTYRKRWQKYLEQKDAKIDFENDFGGKQYIVPKTWIRMPRKPRRLSEEQREELASRMRKVHATVQEKK